MPSPSAPKILDSHIHLWPSTALTSKHHGWMTPGHILTKTHGITHYKAVTSPLTIPFIYVETDRFLPSPSPSIPPSSSPEEQEAKLAEWAAEPLNEIKFLQRIVEGYPDAGDSSAAPDAALLHGVVLWAPFHLPPPLFTIYLRLAERTAGPGLWGRVVGFRHLLQGKPAGAMQQLVRSEAWLENVVSLGMGREGRGWAFDVGVDTHRDGLETLSAAGEMIGEVRRRERERGGRPVRFVLNHLCKPVISNPSSSSSATTSTETPSFDFNTWSTTLQALSSDSDIYMKLSGAFNEFPPSAPPPTDTTAFLKVARPYLTVALDAFQGRTMFGSDWPVCNVGGPKGEEGNWGFWREVVERILEERGMDEKEKERVWWGAAREAYGVGNGDMIVGN